MSSYQWVWRYSCLNVMHKKPYKISEGKTNDVLIAFIAYVNDLNYEVVLAFLLYEGSTVHNANDLFISCF